MDLLFLVWMIDILLNVDMLLTIGVSIYISGGLLSTFIIWQSEPGPYYCDKDSERYLSWKNTLDTSKKLFFRFKTYAFLIVIAVLIPSPQTMKYMGAAYLLQSTFESKFVQETATLSQKAIINQLKVWAEESPDIVPMLENIGVEVKEKALQEVNKALESDKTLEEGK